MHVQERRKILSVVQQTSSRVNNCNIVAVACWSIFTEMLCFRNRNTSIDNSYIPTCYTISVENKQNAGDQPELNHGWRVTMGGSLLTATCHVSRVTIRPTWPGSASSNRPYLRRSVKLIGLVWFSEI